MPEQTSKSVPDFGWATVARDAIEALSHAESGLALQGAPWTDSLLETLTQTQQACESLQLQTLANLSRTIAQTVRTLHGGLVDLAPGTLRLVSEALAQWLQQREALLQAQTSPCATNALRALGGEASEGGGTEGEPTPGKSSALVTDARKYLPFFVEESEEAVDTMQSHLLELEAGVRKSGFIPPQSYVDELFRHAHKLKAACAAMGFTSLAEGTHSMEAVLDRIRGGKLAISAELVSALLSGIDQVRAEVQKAKEGIQPDADFLSVKAALAWFLDTVPKTEHPPAAEPIGLSATVKAKALPSTQGERQFRIELKARDTTPAPEMRLYLAMNRLVRVARVLECSPPWEDLGNLAGQETLSVLVASDQQEKALAHTLRDEELEPAAIAPLAPATAALPERFPPKGTVSGHTLRVPVETLDELMNLAGELSLSKNNFVGASKDVRGWISQAESKGGHGERVCAGLEEAIAQFATLASNIQQTAVNLRMVPILPLFERCRRVVRDVATELGKDVELVLEGGDTLLDKRLIDQLADPLIHMVRNAVDHGIESPSERRARSKPERGTLTLRAEREGSRIRIEVVDDGSGLSLEAIRNQALSQGLLSPAEAQTIDNNSLITYIFQPGFSTAKEVTRISGRGVGMDIVDKWIEEINGTIQVDTQPGGGTAFHISLPLTVVSQNCLLFDSYGVTFALPVHNIAEILQVAPTNVTEMGFGKFVRVREELIPVFRIRHFFQNTHFKNPRGKSEVLNIVILRAGKRKVGLIVDLLHAEEEILVKNAGDLVGDIVGLSGVTVLSSGRVALILDVEKLVEKSTQIPMERSASPTKGHE